MALKSKPRTVCVSRASCLRWLRPLVILSVSLGACSAAPAAWWGDGWNYRRLVVVPNYTPSGLGGDDVAVVTMPTGGQARPDGGDIRVTVADGKEVPYRVLMVGPGDQVRVAFALHGALRYYVYFGNKQAETPKEKDLTLDIRRGVLLEMWEYPGGGFRTFEQVKEIFDANDKVLLGRDIRDRVFQAHNPFGPEDSIAALYTAWLVCPTAGTYTFLASSQNASFLLIDGNMVVANGGAHGVQSHADPRLSNTAQLAAGLHKLSFYHVTSNGDPYAVAAWRAPGEKSILPIPPAAFAPFSRAEPGPMEERGKAADIDFIPEHVGEAFEGYPSNKYYERYHFVALPVGGMAGKLQIKWEFGDGQTATDPNVDHVYLMPGEYTVQLTAAGAGGLTATRTNTVVVSRPWDEVVQNKLDSVRDVVRIVQDYDFRTLHPDAAAEAILLLQKSGLNDVILRAGEAFVGFNKATGPKVAPVISAYVEQLLATKQPEKAVAALAKGASMCGDPAASAELIVQAGTVCLDKLGDAKNAQDLFERAIKQYGNAPAIRAARIGLGDVWRFKGDKDKAADAYPPDKAAETPGGKGQHGPAPVSVQAFAKGDYVRHVEEYLRDGDLESAKEYLDRWADEFPKDKLEGYWSMLYVRWLMAKELYADAVREADILVKVNPESNQGAALLMLSVDAYKKMNQPDKANVTLKRIVDSFPESPLAAKASEALGLTPSTGSGQPTQPAAKSGAAGATSKPQPVKNAPIDARAK